MTEMDLLDQLLWAAAVLGLVGVLTPLVFTLCGGTVLCITAEEDPAAAEPADDDPDYRRRYGQLRDLGFRPVGVVTERAWFFLFHWFWSARHRCLATPDGKCFAALCRLDRGEALRINLTTFTTGGGVVRTAAPGAGVQYHSECSVRTEFQGLEPDALLARHRECVDLFTRQQGVSAVSETLAGYAAADEDHERQMLPSFLDVGPALVAVFLLAPALLGLFVWWLVHGSIGGRGVAVALCVGCAVYVLVTQGVILGLIRRQLRESNPPRKPDTEAG